MLVRLLVIINNDLVPLKSCFLKHIRQEVLVNVVVEIFDCYLDGWWFSNVILINYKSTKSERKRCQQSINRHSDYVTHRGSGKSSDSIRLDRAVRWFRGSRTTTVDTVSP